MIVLRAAFLAASLIAASSAQATGIDCGRARTAADHIICSQPELRARDEAMSILYGAVSGAGGRGPVRDAQWAWIAKVAQCEDGRCLAAAYDDRIGQLLHDPAAGRVARRFHYERGPSNGDLRMLVHGGWITFDIVRTEVGSGGSQSGDVSTAQAGGSTPLKGATAFYRDPSGCTLVFQRLPNGSWVVRQGRLCNVGGDASLSGRYVLARRF